MYTNLISKESLKLINNIITNNLYTFIKSMELAQKFYKDIIQSYLNYIKKEDSNNLHNLSRNRIIFAHKNICRKIDKKQMNSSKVWKQY